MNVLIRVAALTAAMAGWHSPLAQTFTQATWPEDAPPPAPPIAVAPALPPAPGGLRTLAAQPYSIGQPTPEEQLYVEMINRARANPVAESLLFLNTSDSAVVGAYTQFEVDLPLMLGEFAALPAVPPLAINPLLTTAARRQTQDMFDHAFQGHDGTDGSTPSSRATEAGYSWSMVGENVYARAKSVFHGHAGFEVDWGPGTGGMQTGRGHRVAIHNAGFREVGVGVLHGSNEVEGTPPVGPRLVTQVFGTAQGATPLITGVAYYDLNGNNFYDLGEGIGGVTVEASGASAQAVTANSGGFALPVPGNGEYTVTFSGSAFAPSSQNVTVSSLENVKVDFIPAYLPPTISGPLNPAIDRANSYTATSVGGAVEYEWRSFQKAVPQVQGAENGSAQITIDQSAGYEVFESLISASGSFAFHLAHPGTRPVPQSITLTPSYLVGPGASLQFRSRLGWAAADQHARVQVSTDDGVSWETLYSQSGTGDMGETAFTLRTVGLSDYEGKTIRARFVYDWQNGGFYNQTDAIVGWLIDDIQLLEVDQVANSQSTVSPTASFQFQPAALGEYALQVRARAGHEYLPWGPVYSVQAVEAGAAPEFRVASFERVGAELHLEIEVISGTVAADDLILESRGTFEEPWASVDAALQSNLRVVIPLGNADSAFFRIRTQ